MVLCDLARDTLSLYGVAETGKLSPHLRDLAFKTQGPMHVIKGNMVQPSLERIGKTPFQY